MKKNFSCLLILTTALLAHGRLIDFWSHQKLYDESDLVVIAKPLSTKEAPEANPPQSGYPLVGLSTEFEISLVMKGDKDLKKLVLHHGRLDKSKIKDGIVINGPNLVSFDPKQGISYLLFLRREADGRFAPVDGQYDPAMFSVVKLAHAR